MPVFDAAAPPRMWSLGPEGERQAGRLANALRRFAPLRLVSSAEPKAMRTAELVAAALAIRTATTAGLEEFDRPAMPWMTKEQHERSNAPIFEKPATRILGHESGDEALARFSRAIDAELGRTSDPALAVITHGTVTALFVAAHNPVDGFELWKSLACGSFVVLDVPSMALREVETAAGG
jgi:broad specificity phosphatase PhoE